MPKSLSFSIRSSTADDEAYQAFLATSNPPSPLLGRPTVNSYSTSNLRSQMPLQLGQESANNVDENTGLLAGTENRRRRYIRSVPGTPGPPFSVPLSRKQSITGSLRIPKHHTHAPSWLKQIATPLTSPNLERTRSSVFRKSRTNLSRPVSTYQDDRMWYDQFTSTDWVHDSIADGYRVRELQKRKDIRGRLWLFFDSAQGWVLVALIGCITALIAYFVDVTESSIFDVKEGFCRKKWYWNRNKCCSGIGPCEDWRSWSNTIQISGFSSFWIDYTAFTVGCLALALSSCYLTLLSKTVVPSHVASTLDENLGALKVQVDDEENKDPNRSLSPPSSEKSAPSIIYYSAAGSGVAEVKVILSGFILHGYLGIKTLLLKTAGLILSVASGMSLGKEGPYVHIATCVGNIACRLFSKYNINDGKRREVLSAAAAGGVAVAFGAPIGGVLFSLEEVSYYFPPKTLFRTFFCCIAAALSLKFLNPYGTSKIVFFEVRYLTDWRFLELINFAFLGCAGGVAGALFIKASRFWATTFRRNTLIRSNPMLEVALVALVTGLISFWNKYTKLAVTELLFELASPCDPKSNTGLCPAQEDIPQVILYLTAAFVIKSFLTIITFGIKVPAGIYVPSMVVGGLLGRIVGHATQYFVLTYPDFFLFANCPQTGGPEACVTPGVYALVAAGATMCGVTRLSVTLAVILFELTGSLDHVLPFSLAILVAKWTADALEPLSIYDLLTDMNEYPFLDNRLHLVFDNELGDITRTSSANGDRVIDISESPLVYASDLRDKVATLQTAGELDGGLPIVRDRILVGLIPIPDLEFVLDQMSETEDEAGNENSLCLLAHSNPNHHHHYGLDAIGADDGLRIGSFLDDLNSHDDVDGPVTDLTPYVDPSPVALDIHSPMDLVYQCFVKLGLRHVCVLRGGEFAGLVHKKGFVRFVKEMQMEQRRRRHDGAR